MLFTQPTPPDDALAFANRVIVGSPMSSSEWQDVPAELRARAFFSSQVEDARFLQRARDSINDFLASNRDPETGALKTGGRAAFVDQMQKFLEQNGAVRTSGDLQDFTSQSRLSLIFDTMTNQSHSYGYWKSGLDPALLNMWPASRFIRVTEVKEPRLNHEIYQGKVFLKTDPIWWRVINRDFGVPWAPFGWGCGHDIQDVGRDEAEALGLIKPGERLDVQSLLKKFSLNSGLQASVLNIAPELLEKLKQVFGNQIAIEGDAIKWQANAVKEIVTPTIARTSPVSDALDVRVSGALKIEVNTAISAIDKVHDDGDLPEIPVLPSRASSFGFLRSAYSSAGQTATQIGVRATGQWPALTTAHEAGHLLDLEAIGAKGSFATLSGDENMKEVLDAANDTAAIRGLRDKLKTTQSVEKKRVLNYYLKPPEIWARAYAQFIAEKSGSPILLRQVDAALKSDPLRQWTPDDFKPLSDAIEAMFQKLGWL